MLADNLRGRRMIRWRCSVVERSPVPQVSRARVPVGAPASSPLEANPPPPSDGKTGGALVEFFAASCFELSTEELGWLVGVDAIINWHD